MLRTPLLAAARSRRARSLVETAPPARAVVRRFVAGAAVPDAIGAVRSLTADGLQVTLDHLGEDTADASRAAATVTAYERLLAALAAEGLGRGADVSVKLSAVGQSLAADGEKIALDNALRIGDAAAAAGATVTLDMEDHTTTDSTLAILRELRTAHPSAGGVLQAHLRRTAGDCRDLAHAGSRVRLCKGAYAEPESVAYRTRPEVDRSYARCLGILMCGAGYPMAATHDPRLIALTHDLAEATGRTPADHEYQMLYGIRPAEQHRLASTGATMRVYVPYGDEWYGYFMRRLAERPANVVFFLRALIGRTGRPRR